MSIKEYAFELRLPYIRSMHQEFIQEAKHLGLDYDDFLVDLLKNELEMRNNNGIKNRIRNAKFTHKKYLEDFRHDGYSRELQKKFKELESLDFIGNKENIILISNPGRGKTHYSIGLGIKACMEGKKVLFVSVPNLVIELKEAMSMNQVNQYKKRFEKYDLVILDELGYITFDKEGSEILFNLLSNRNDTGSIIITTNLIFERWEEIFKDPVLTGAMIDRLAYKAHILDLSGDSYRIKITSEWLTQKT